MTDAIDPQTGPAGTGLATRLLLRFGGRAPSPPRVRIAGRPRLSDHLLRDVGLSRSDLAELDRPSRRITLL